MPTFKPSSFIVKNSLTNSTVNILASNPTGNIIFEALTYSSQVNDLLTLAGQALAASTPTTPPEPVEFVYETLNGLNLLTEINAYIE